MVALGCSLVEGSVCPRRSHRPASPHFGNLRLLPNARDCCLLIHSKMISKLHLSLILQSFGQTTKSLPLHHNYAFGWPFLQLCFVLPCDPSLTRSWAATCGSSG